MDLTNYNIKSFCAEADIKLSDIDSDFWLALDRETRCEFVRLWWLDNDDKGYSAGKGAEKCAEFFCSKTNSIRGLQNETFKGDVAPWQEGYKSDWRAAAVYAARDNSDKYTPQPTDYAEPSTEADARRFTPEEQQAARKLLDEAGFTVEGSAAAVEGVTQLAQQSLITGWPEPPQEPEGTPKTRKARGPSQKTPWIFEDGEFKAKVPGHAICVCPSCGATALNNASVLFLFSSRYDDEAKTKPRPQSLCKTCRKDHAKSRRATKTQQLDLPSGEA